VRPSAAALLLAVGVALLMPGAVAGKPNTPGDPTPPVVTPMITGTLGTNGWYVTNTTVGWKVEDPESVILSTSGCDTKTLTSDTSGNTLTCTATSDGGTTTVSKTFKVDKTAPAVTATPARNPDSNGWYNHALTVSFMGSDSTSGIASCVAPRNYSGPDGGSVSVSGTCTDLAGNVGSTAFSLGYDASAPIVTPTAGRSADANGWYNHPLAISFVGSDSTSGIETCTQSTYSGPDNGSASLSGSCRDRAGNQSGASAFAFSYDATAPHVTGSSAGRAPDVNGWYNHALSVTFAGVDATSGIASCTQTTYAGPDSGSASVSGSCRDRAGNQSGSSSFPFAYDATPPTVSTLSSRPGNRRVDLSWAASADTKLVQVTRVRGGEKTTIYRGNAASYRDSRLKVGAKYHYTVTAFDAAGNSAAKRLTVTATGALLSPVPGARVRSAPLLRWTAVKGASYYNVQLLRRGRTILSAWPTNAHFKVPRSWVFHGHRVRLQRGVYRWYVWPGFGGFSASRYGHLLGGSSFVLSG
jgi:hypothetical protein